MNPRVFQYKFIKIYMLFRLYYAATDILAKKGCKVVSPTAGVIDEVNRIDRWSGKTNLGPDRGGLSVSIIGDDGVSPTPPQIVRTWLHEKFASRIAGKTVILREFSIQVVDPDAHIDERSYANAANSTPGANPLSMLFGRLLIGGIEGIRGKNRSVFVLRVRWMTGSSRRGAAAHSGGALAKETSTRSS